MAILGNGCSPRSAIRVIILDSNRIGGQLLAAALKRDKFEVVFAGACCDEAVRALSTNSADVALVSASLEGVPDKGFEVAVRLKHINPRLQSIMLLDTCSREYVIKAFRSGVRGVFGRDDSLEALGKCVTRVQQGQVWANTEALEFMLEALIAPPRVSVVSATGTQILAPREQEVVHWVFEGLTNREIAEKMGLSENTVKNYLFRIFDKLGISKRVELILYAASQFDANSAKLAQSADPKVAIGSDQTLFEWCSAAAEKFSCNEYVLGELYRDGRGVQMDKSVALAWFMLAEKAAVELNSSAQTARQKLQNELSALEVARAKRLLQQWVLDSKRQQKTAGELKIAV